MKLPRGTIAAAFVAICALADLRVALRPEARPIPEDVMRSAVDKLKAASKPGDIVVHSPLLRVEELAALGNLHASPQLPPPEWLNSRRIVLLDRRDQRMHGFGSPTEVIDLPQSNGLLEIDVFEPTGGAEVPLFSLRTGFSSSTMRVERQERVTRCDAPRTDGGFGCPGEPEWLYIQAKSQVVDGQDTPCTWAHPTNGGTIVFEIPALPAPRAGRRLVVSLSGALSDDAVRNTGDGANVRTDVVQSGQTKGTVVVPNRIGWQRGSFNVEPGLPIELRVTTPRDGRRHHCVNAEVLEIDQANGAGS
jgi:hypothetical protein